MSKLWSGGVYAPPLSFIIIAFFVVFCQEKNAFFQEKFDAIDNGLNTAVFITP